ncbi:hypothetical protein SDC9_145457 [bioreactor metagenome]|uniref:Uncharacterized protein n=1 Tax=bioreactor metagenome TaxID=1076179 RepID=A0A645EC91_9ZZZZ
MLEVRQRHVDAVPLLGEQVDDRRAEQVKVVLGDHLFQRGGRLVEVQHELDARGAHRLEHLAQAADFEEAVAVRAGEILVQKAIAAEALLVVGNQRLVIFEAHATDLIGGQPRLVILPIAAAPFDGAAHKAAADQLQQ